MLIKFLIGLFVFLSAVYYVTVGIHLVIFPIFSVKKFSLGKSMIPFYYWKNGWNK